MFNPNLCFLSFSAPLVMWLLDGFVAEWIHFTLLGIILPTIKLKVYTFLGLMNSATKTGKSSPKRNFTSSNAPVSKGPKEKKLSLNLKL